MLPQPLTYSNFYYNYALLKLYNILVRGAETKITKDYIFGKGGRASAGPRCGFAPANKPILNMLCRTSQ